MTTAPLEHVTLWRDNRLDAAWTITIADLAARFAAVRHRDIPFERDLLDFITRPDGLSSVFTVDTAALLDAVYDAYVAIRDTTPPAATRAPT
jgi:hypothetical protein